MYRRLLGLGALVLSPLLAHSASSVDLGQRLYREGLGVDGKPVAAVVQGDVPVNGAQLACVGCHKRSGLGASEGGSRALVVTGPVLFGPKSARPDNLLRSRAPYTDQTLRTAIEAGRDSDGRVIDALMPRYRLSNADMAALSAYLKVLGTVPAQGVGPNDIELATIVSERAPVRDREAVAAVVQHFAGFKNGVSRNEKNRAEASRRHVYGERHARAFRRWHVSVWTLSGAPSEWPAQLEALYAQRPPFAVISGAAGDDWAVVGEFCERRGLPCVLPVTDLPRMVTGQFFNVYFSEGTRLDARVTASSIGQGRDEAGGKILLLHTDDARGQAARDAFVSAWPDSGSGVEATAVAAGAPPSPRYWQDLLERARPAVLIAWIAPAQLQSLISATSGQTSLPSRIYTAESFTDWTVIKAPEAFERRVIHVYPYNLPPHGLAQFPREQVWLKAQGLGDLAMPAAAEALFACHAVGEALLGMADNYSREYLIETLEHVLDGTGMTTIFPVTTLGTGQRYLVKGAYVTRLSPQGGTDRYVSSGWVQP